VVCRESKACGALAEGFRLRCSSLNCPGTSPSPGFGRVALAGGDDFAVGSLQDEPETILGRWISNFAATSTSESWCFSRLHTRKVRPSIRDNSGRDRPIALTSARAQQSGATLRHWRPITAPGPRGGRSSVVRRGGQPGLQLLRLSRK
jgi:hypothetical protein